MAQNIEPYRQTVQACLKDKIYYIDFYQREYVWSDETVKILLDDIFVLGYTERVLLMCISIICRKLRVKLVLLPVSYGI